MLMLLQNKRGFIEGNLASNHGCDTLLIWILMVEILFWMVNLDKENWLL